MIRHPEVRALARLEGRRPACGQFILRGSPSGASAPQGSHLRMTGRHKLVSSRHDLPEVFQIRCPSVNRGRRECRVRAAPAVSCAKNCAFGAHEHTGERKHSDIPCAMALRLTSCSPRWSGLVVTVTRGETCLHELDASIAAPGPHDLAVRLGVSSGAKKAPDAKASIASPAQRIVTIAKRPLVWVGMATLIILISRIGKRNIFAFRGLT